jgi:hypothetical protein
MIGMATRSWALAGRARTTFTSRAIGLGADFAIFRFGPRRDRAFEVLR